MSLYWQAHVWLLVSYGVFRGALGILALRFRPSALGFLRWGQLTLVAALGLPFLAAWLPTDSLLPMPEGLRLPLAEMGEALSPSPKIVAVSVPIQRQPEAPKFTPVGWVQSAIRAVVLFFLFCGILIFLFRILRERRKLRRLLVSCQPFKKLGRVQIVTTDEGEVPFSCRLGGTAWVVLPESLLGRWSDFKIAVWHELEHHRQRDTVWAVAIEWVVAVFFFNPAVYRWRRLISEFGELSCDESLIGRKVSPAEYGGCLLRVAEAALADRHVWVGTARMADGAQRPAYFKSFLKRRIEMIYDPKPNRRERWLSGFAGTVVLVSLMLGAYVARQLDAQPKVGDGTVVTDPGIQSIAEQALTGALTRHKATLGFVVVSDPKTGRILAVANEDRMEKEAKRSPHWALSLRVGPASLSKVFVAAAAVDKGATTFAELHNCEKKKYKWEGTLYQDWKAFDKLSTADMLVHSSNICGIKVGQKLGATGIAEAFGRFGFGQGGTAENFPESRSGVIPSPQGDGDRAYIAGAATGYGSLYVSPLETVQAFGAIANGGNLLMPQSTTDKSVSPKVVRRAISEGTARELRQVLAEVMTRGTAREAGSKKFRLAGKTATGYSHTHVEHDTLGGDSNLAAFAGFGPVEDPRVVVFAVVENPNDQKGVHGSTHAAPLFTEVAEKTLAYLKVPESTR